MKYSVFNQTPNDATKEPMFFGQPVNVLRFVRFKASDKLRRQCKEHLSATTKS